MKNFLIKIKTCVITHKTLSVVGLIILLLLGYWGYKKITNTSNEIRYVTSVVQKGTIVSSVDGTGQVSASSQVDLKTKASGDIVYIGVVSGQKVSAGTLIAQINTEEAQKSLRDAELNLQNSKISLEKIKLQNSEENINADLEKAYEDGFSNVSSVFLDLPTILMEVENILSEENLSENSARNSGGVAVNYRSQAESLYYQAYKVFQTNRSNFRKMSSSSSRLDVENIINETYDTTKTFSDMVKSTKNFVDYMIDDTNRASDYSTSQDLLTGYTNTLNGHLTSLFSAKQDIKDNKENTSTSNLDIQSSEISVKQKENALQDLKDNLSNYYVRAPFDGSIANISIEKSDSVSSGVVVASLITEKQIAEIPFNEVDVAKIKVGQKATLTFDAISDLTISGEVAEIDSVGTVSSGVVNYNVKISFDTQDDRVKPGMSTTAAIITNVSQNIIVIASSAVKTQNNQNYVEIFDTALSGAEIGVQGSVSSVVPNKVTVGVGISDDTQTEITSGLKEGDIVVTKTIIGTTSTATKTTSTKSILGNMGGGGPPN